MLTSLILYFALAGFFGWIYETAAMSFYEGKWDNRGFLSGPFLPIYAFGCLGCLLVFSFLMPGSSMLQVFLVGVIGSAVLEFATSVVLEKVFHCAWWDYSICPGNIQGRICPPASLGFGVAALIIVFIVNPKLWPLITLIPGRFAKLVAVSWVLLFLTDVVHTVLRLKFGFHDFQALEDWNDRMDRFVDRHHLTDKSICERVHEHIGDAESLGEEGERL